MKMIQFFYRERVPFGLGTALHRAAEFGKIEIAIFVDARRRSIEVR
jgi:hypothetical protein